MNCKDKTPKADTYAERAERSPVTLDTQAGGVGIFLFLLCVYKTSKETLWWWLCEQKSLFSFETLKHMFRYTVIKM